jgi:hypothetical protein
MCRFDPTRVTPFGYLRITGCVLLTAAFRSLPRPSSPDSPKASTMNPYSLDHMYRYALRISISRTRLLTYVLCSLFLHSFAGFLMIYFLCDIYILKRL